MLWAIQVIQVYCSTQQDRNGYGKVHAQIHQYISTLQRKRRRRCQWSAPSYVSAPLAGRRRLTGIGVTFRAMPVISSMPKLLNLSKPRGATPSPLNDIDCRLLAESESFASFWSFLCRVSSNRTNFFAALPFGDMILPLLGVERVHEKSLLPLFGVWKYGYALTVDFLFPSPGIPLSASVSVALLSR